MIILMHIKGAFQASCWQYELFQVLYTLQDFLSFTVQWFFSLYMQISIQSKIEGALHISEIISALPSSFVYFPAS